MLRSRFRPILMLLLVLSLTTVALTACGSGKSSNGSGRSDDEKRLAFEDCLRDEGVDVVTTPDGRTGIRSSSTEGGGERQQIGGPEDAGGPFDKCREKTGWAPSPPTAAEQARARDEGLRMARCMRAHGADMDDPAPDGRQMIRIDARSPTVQAAMKACGMAGPGGAGPVQGIGGR